MAKKIYDTEREGQVDFFENYRIPWKEEDGALIDNTDGVWNGCLMEFKLNIGDINKVQLQAVKYMSRMRVKGESVPAAFLLIALNEHVAYVCKSQDYFEEIHKVYSGGASKGNEGFVGKPYDEKIDYSDEAGSLKLKNLLKKEKPDGEKYMPIRIDEDCIVGWAERYYRENPKASKGDFIGDTDGHGAINITGEIREPRAFKGLILPYEDKTNEKFKYLMDKLNDRLRKKDLGAFYTPMPYAEKACELVKKAIDKVPEGNDYIILDRCAGTGALEEAVINVLGDDVAGHIICSTYEYYEYKVLAERVGDKVRCILPPTEQDVVYEQGMVKNADAMSEEYVSNPLIRQYVDDPKCTVILFENPPYRDMASGMASGKAVRTGKQRSYVCEEMKKEVSGVATNDLANQFIWSALKYYLRAETDSYIVFSPVKYWKQYRFMNGACGGAFVFNRKHFHATESAVGCILWENTFSSKRQIEAECFDIVDGALKSEGNLTIKRVSRPASARYSKIEFGEADRCSTFCEKSGEEAVGKAVRVKGYANNSVIGYLEADAFSISPIVRNLTRLCLYNGHGCYLARENYLGLLPLWCAKHIPLDNWYENDVYATTSDGGEGYMEDAEFLKECLIFACLSNQDKCLSFKASDGKEYQNELCFDNAPSDMPGAGKMPVALRDLRKMELNEDETALMSLWGRILASAQKTKNYDPHWNYGVYQISKELNTYTEQGEGKQKKKVYDYPELNGDLNTLRVKLKEYYKKYIRPKMFKYQLIK